MNVKNSPMQGPGVINGFVGLFRMQLSIIINSHHRRQKTRTPPPCVSSSPMATLESSVGKRSPQLEEQEECVGVERLKNGDFKFFVELCVCSVISWKATLQPSVGLSTTEAEYMTLTEAEKEGIWLKDQVYYGRTKHIDVRYHFIRTERRIKVKKIGTHDNFADVFTKLVPLSKFRYCLDLLNIDNWKYGVT
ncbi:retrovirus-related pol polyprotein from transposon TNT 1-94 [Tanacetum coccineum]